MFIVDKEATERLHSIMRELRDAKERRDGSYSALMSESVFVPLNAETPT